MNSTDFGENDVVNERASSAVKIWICIVAISFGLFLLTFNPLFAGIIPYLHAGWPAARTAFWLRTADPWRARGAASFCFHMAMAGFRAGTCGFAAVIVAIFLQDAFKQNVDLNQFIVAMCVIMGGCLASFVFGWIGTYFAARYGVRVFVVSKLFHICRGDFSRIATLPMERYFINPANYVMAIAITVPTLAGWFALMLISIPENFQNREPGWLQYGLLLSLPFLAIGCIVALILLSNRMIARTPWECWGVPIPDTGDDASNAFPPANSW